jgi:cob(I)alamin adenosyltransferase
MKIYTRTGDKGETGLFGGGRVSKADARVEAYGNVDELNSTIGWALTQQTLDEVKAELRGIQADLFVLGSHLATPAHTTGRRPTLPDLPTDRIAVLEHSIDAMEENLPPLKTFVLPGGSPAGAALHLARTVCRRAERQVIALAGGTIVDPSITVYLNRLSDYLFVLARHVNRTGGFEEQPWP